MAIHLITGVPGSGKTLKMISDLMNKDDLKNRPLYLDGIPEVKQEVIPHLPIPEGETMKTWHKWAPTGSILVIDECQRVFRPRSSGSAVPEFVAELETHRHKGIDFFLLTQHPRLIDVNVRSLIGHHTHISKTNLGVRRMLQWERCANPEANTDVSNAVKSVYTLDKKAYGVYKSAEEHTKIKTKLSKVVFILPFALLLILIGSYYVYNSWQDIKKPIEIPAQVDAETASSPSQGGTVGAAALNGTDGVGQYPPQAAYQQPEQKPHLTENDFKPAIEGLPHTAPIYNAMNKNVQTMPYPAGCVQNGDRCTCYTDQGTPIKGFKKSQCIDFVKNGIYNPYLNNSNSTENNITNNINHIEDVNNTEQVIALTGEDKLTLNKGGEWINKQ